MILSLLVYMCEIFHNVKFLKDTLVQDPPQG